MIEKMNIESLENIWVGETPIIVAKKVNELIEVINKLERINNQHVQFPLEGDQKNDTAR